MLHLHEYDSRRPMRPWLFAFAVRMARDYRRLARHRHEVMDETAGTTSDVAPAADQLLAARQDHELVMRALDALDWDKRVVFVACELEEQEVTAVAAMLGVSRNTAASRLRLARAEFTVAVRRLARRERHG